MTIQAAIQQGTQLLADGAILAPRLTAEVLLCHALGKDRPYLYGHPEAELREVEWIHYGRYLHERLGGKPTQYITHRQEFYGRTFRVTPDVLIPRPETEHLVEAAIPFASQADGIVDAGCGSGAIAVTLSLEAGRPVMGTDISTAALAVAAGNARDLCADVRLIGCDLLAALASRSMDLLVSNPPYVPDGEIDGLQREVRDYEPRVALTGGPTGCEIYARLIGQAGQVLRPGGHLIVELGFRTVDRVMEMTEPLFTDVRLIDDLAGIPRVLSCRLR